MRLRQSRVEFKGAPGRGHGPGDGLLGQEIAVEAGSQQYPGVAQARVSQRVFRIALDGLLEIGNRAAQGILCTLVPIVPAVQVQVVSLKING